MTSMRTLFRGGRVIDPAGGFDGAADVLVADGKIAAVGTDLAPPTDTELVDATGLVIGPGFVDLHSHVHSIAGHRLQAMDGVTTALDLEAGLMPVERAYAEAAAAGRPLHFGFSASWGGARAQVLAGITPDARIASSLAVLGDPRWQRSSSPRELAAWLSLLEDELAAGALGIGILMGYAPATEPAEFRAVARLAAKAGAPTFTHVRELVEMDPATPVDGSTEIAIAAAETGAAMHHCHVNSTSGRHVDRVLNTLEESRQSGSRVTVEAYPYGAGSTAVGAAFIAPERLRLKGLGPSSVIMVETGNGSRTQPAWSSSAHKTRARPASWNSSTRTTRATWPCCGRHSPSPTPSSPATRCPSSGPTAATTAPGGPCHPAARHTLVRPEPSPRRSA